MPGLRWHCPILALLRQPGAGWLLLATTYLAAAVLSVYLALSMSVWWPLVLVVCCLVAATACAITAARRARPEVSADRSRGSGAATARPRQDPDRAAPHSPRPGRGRPVRR